MRAANDKGGQMQSPGEFRLGPESVDLGNHEHCVVSTLNGKARLLHGLSFVLRDNRNGS